MTRSGVISIIFLFISLPIYSQDYTVETSRTENINGSFTTTNIVELIKSPRSELPWNDLSISSSTNSFRNYYEISLRFTYAGTSYRFYNRIALNIDGNVFNINLNGLREYIGNGIYAELFIINLPRDVARMLQIAKMVKIQTAGNRYIDDIVTLDEETLLIINDFLKDLNIDDGRG